MCRECVMVYCSCFIQTLFFFKQKTAYEMLRSLVGSEMCIRDRTGPAPQVRLGACDRGAAGQPGLAGGQGGTGVSACLLYTSDAADDLPCVDLGGRRTIKKKKHSL